MRHYFATTLLGLTPLVAVSSVDATSIVSPAFSEPVIHKGRAYLAHTHGTQVTCFDLRQKTILWRVDLKKHYVSRLCLGPADEIIVAGNERITGLSPGTGKIVREYSVSGAFDGIDASERIFLSDYGGGRLVRCYDYKTGKKRWEIDPGSEGSNIELRVRSELVVAMLTPRLMVSSSQGTIIKEGRSEIVALDPSDGHALWRRKVPLTREGHSAWMQLKVGQTYAACAAGSVLLLLDPSSGQMVKTIDPMLELDDVEWLSGHELVLCDGSAIKILDVQTGVAKSRFDAPIEGVAGVAICGRVLLTHALYRNYGIDLTRQKLVWEKSQRWQTAYAGRVYYGESQTISESERYRIFGVCEPETGRDTVLYRERVIESVP